MNANNLGAILPGKPIHQAANHSPGETDGDSLEPTPRHHQRQQPIADASSQDSEKEEKKNARYTFHPVTID